MWRSDYIDDLLIWQITQISSICQHKTHVNNSCYMVYFNFFCCFLKAMATRYISTRTFFQSSNCTACRIITYHNSWRIKKYLPAINGIKLVSIFLSNQRDISVTSNSHCYCYQVSAWKGRPELEFSAGTEETIFICSNTGQVPGPKFWCSF